MFFEWKSMRKEMLMRWKQYFSDSEKISEKRRQEGTDASIRNKINNKEANRAWKFNNLQLQENSMSEEVL